MIDWKLAPKGAETLRQVKKFGYLRWFNSEDQAWFGKEWDFAVDEYETLATRPTQTKTVADAVEWAEGKWVGGDSRFIVFHKDLEKFTFVVTSGPYENGWKLVCTRAEFEAYVKEQESEKWTHIDAFGDPCRILTEEKDKLGYVVVLRENGHYAIPAASSLKPIKPRITKAQAWDKLQYMAGIEGYTYSNVVEEIYDRYEVIDD